MSPAPIPPLLRAVLLVVLAATLACSPAADSTVGSAPDGDTATRDDADDDPATATATPAQDLPDLGAAPDLVGIDGWLQADGIDSLDDLSGSVVVVQMWTFSCINCKRTLPNLAELHERHADDDFEIVGVHAPEFDFERDPDAVAEAADELGVTWPIALDTDRESFHTWQDPGGNFWPRTFVLDRDGHIRFDHVGEGAYDQLNEAVATLLADPVT